MPKKDNLPRLTEDDVRQMTDGRSFERGESYYEAGAIIEPVRQGMELRAECQGSQYEPYQVNVTLNQKGIASYDCSCPRGGFCKHIVALMLTYIHEPEAFRTLPPLEEMLAPRSKEELIALVAEMVKREPGLMSLVELSASITSKPGKPVDAEVYRRQVQRVLRRSDPWNIERELRTLCSNANRLAQSGDWLNAGALYDALLSGISEHYEDDLWGLDEDGDIAALASDCAEALGRCLTQGRPDEDTRRAWLTALLEGTLTDIRLGGIDYAWSARDVVLQQTTDAEWAWMEQRIRAEIERSERWKRESLVGLLIERREHAGQSADAAELIRELGTPEQRTWLLLQEGNVDDAVAMAREYLTGFPGTMIKFADALVEAGAGEAAVALLSEQTAQGRGYEGWLAKYFREHGAPHAVLDWQRKVFARQPSVEHYKTLREVSEKAGVWEPVRLEVLRDLEDGGKFGTLIEIALYENDVGRALELLPKFQQKAYYGWAQSYKQLVAKAAEKDYPQESLALYKELVERAIGEKNRSSYQSAAQFLKCMKELHGRLHTDAEWDVYIETLRARHARLPALQDELRKAKL